MTNANGIEQVLASLPERCRTCVFRPVQAEGNGGCHNVNEALGQLTMVVDSLAGSGQARRVMQHFEVGDIDSRNSHRVALDSVQHEAARAKSQMSGTLQQYSPKDSRGMAIDVDGEPIALCFGELSQFMQPDARTSTPIGIIELARLVTECKEAGINVAPVA